MHLPFVAIVALLVGSLVCPAALAGERIVPFAPLTEKLPNGLTVVRVPYPSAGIAAFYTVVRVGSRNEVEPKHTGFAHFFEHMMFKGTPKQPEGAREKTLSRLGFNENAFTTDDLTVYHVVGPSAELKTLISLEADRFQNLSYSEPTFQTEALAVLGEYHKNAANPGLKIEEALNAAAFSRHTYQHTTLGFYDDIQAMPKYYAYSKTFFRRWYTPDNTFIFVVGDFDDVQIMNWVREAYSSWKGKVAPIQVPKEPPSKQEKSVSVTWKTATLPRHLEAWRTPSSYREAAIQNLLGAYLVGPTSPTYRKLVLEEQWVQSLQSEYSEHRDPGLFILGATLKDEANRVPVQRAIQTAMSELISGKVDSQRVAAIKSHLKYNLLMSFEVPNEVAMHLSYFAGLYGEPDALENIYQSLEKIAPEELISFAQKHFHAKNRVVLEFKPEADTKKGKE